MLLLTHWSESMLLIQVLKTAALIGQYDWGAPRVRLLTLSLLLRVALTAAIRIFDHILRRIMSIAIIVQVNNSGGIESTVRVTVAFNATRREGRSLLMLLMGTCCIVDHIRVEMVPVCVILGGGLALTIAVWDVLIEEYLLELSYVLLRLIVWVLAIVDHVEAHGAIPIGVCLIFSDWGSWLAHLGVGRAISSSRRMGHFRLIKDAISYLLFLFWALF